MTRDMRRRAVLAGLFVFGALLLGAQPAPAAPAPPTAATEATVEASPPKPIGPTDLAPPTAVDPPTTTPPPPPPPVTTTTKPARPARPAAKPAAPPPPAPTTATTPPSSEPTTEPTGIPVPDRIDAGGNVPGPPTVLFWVVPGLAVLTLAAGVSGYWLARSEVDSR